MQDNDPKYILLLFKNWLKCFLIFSLKILDLNT